MICFLPALAPAQDVDTIVVRKAAKDTFVMVEEMPYLVACTSEESIEARNTCTFNKLNEILVKNIRYPTEAMDANITGTVYVSFVVMTDGSTDSVKVLRGIGGGCDEEAVRVAKLIGPWKPGLVSGKAVSVTYTFPVRYALKDGGASRKKKSRK